MALYAEAIIAAEYPVIICHPVQNYVRNKKAGGKIKSDQPSPIPDPKSLAAGDTVVFGNYYYDYKYPKDKMPIEWVVLDVRDGRALIISKYALMNYPYLDHSGTCTWETSSVREWLNNDFYKEAFTEEERKVIGLTGLTNADNPKYGTDGGNNTTDYVFVLSADEAGTYFSSDKERQAKGTTWAYNNGLALISPETGDYSSVVFNGAYGYIADYNCMYWLRTPGADNGAAAFVDEKGTVQPGGSYAYYYPNADPKVASPLPELGVRPVLWLNADTAETDASNASEYEISAEERAIEEAYREVVKNYSNGEADTPQYDFGFIDNDNIPELLIAGGNSDAAGVEIYTCKDGAAQRTGVFGQDGNLRYLPYEDTIFTHQADMGCSLNTWYHLDGSIIHTLRNTIEGQEPDPVNEVDDTAVSKEEYERLQKFEKLDLLLQIADLYFPVSQTRLFTRCRTVRTRQLFGQPHCRAFFIIKPDTSQFPGRIQSAAGICTRGVLAQHASEQICTVQSALDHNYPPLNEYSCFHCTENPAVSQLKSLFFKKMKACIRRKDPHLAVRVLYSVSFSCLSRRTS